MSRRACFCVSPSVFQLSQQAPNKRVAGDHAHAGEQAERREPVPPAAAVGAAVDADALQQRAEHDALRERGHERAAGEREIPDRAGAPGRASGTRRQRRGTPAPAASRSAARTAPTSRWNTPAETPPAIRRRRAPARFRCRPTPARWNSSRCRVRGPTPNTGNRMPMPRSKPSMTTYMNTANARIAAQTLVSSVLSAMVRLLRRAARGERGSRA